MITNKEVKNALDHCINKRWRLLAQDETLYNVSKCALCELFGGRNERVGYHFKPSSKCKGCPVYLCNGVVVRSIYKYIFRKIRPSYAAFSARHTEAFLWRCQMKPTSLR